ncbi:MAG: hypothetical protein Sylvanvirus13_20 [Sylvanvirus sp.]|uniref:F-box domain-containing protein n=1 Tax=Sylvanvirus sp. TaxID=2487774 RepID=A0A3G5AKR8_9VIRU|nr:MAG: hypothetical protein Sylvanvirus13_20 [Sylvanvirus sp.]
MKRIKQTHDTLSSSICDIHPRMKSLIFQYIDAFTRISSIRVSRRWFQSFQHPLVWQPIIVSYHAKMLGYIKSKVLHYSMISILELKIYDACSNIYSSSLLFTCVRVLEFNRRIDIFSGFSQPAFILFCKNLESLTLRQIFTSSLEQLQTFWKSLHLLPFLTSLSMSHICFEYLYLHPPSEFYLCDYIPRTLHSFTFIYSQHLPFLNAFPFIIRYVPSVNSNSSSNLTIDSSCPFRHLKDVSLSTNMLIARDHNRDISSPIAHDLRCSLFSLTLSKGELFPYMLEGFTSLRTLIIRKAVLLCFDCDIFLKTLTTECPRLETCHLLFSVLKRSYHENSHGRKSNLHSKNIHSCVTSTMLDQHPSLLCFKALWLERDKTRNRVEVEHSHVYTRDNMYGSWLHQGMITSPGESPVPIVFKL